MCGGGGSGGVDGRGRGDNLVEVLHVEVSVQSAAAAEEKSVLAEAEGGAAAVLARQGEHAAAVAAVHDAVVEQPFI